MKEHSRTFPAKHGSDRKKAGRVSFAVSAAAMALVRGYQLILSPVMPGSCRFSPSCSNYALEAFRRHPPMRALWLAVRRIGRCHPFHPGGHDPVP